MRLAVLHFVEALRGRRVLLWEDNQAVVAILTSLTTHSPLLMRELRLLMQVLDMADIALRAMYIRSIDNRVADHFSRIARPRDYSIRADVFYEVKKKWGSCTVDAFSSEATAMLLRFWAERAGGAAEAADAFAQEWRGDQVWAHPPVGALPQLAQFLRERPALDALVCPCGRASLGSACSWS